MYDSSFKLYFDWQCNAQGGYVVPFWHHNGANRQHLEYVDLFDSNGVWKGAWDRPNIPLGRIHWIERACKEWEHEQRKRQR